MNAPPKRPVRETRGRRALRLWLDAKPSRTQTALAAALCVEQPLISAWLKGRARPSPKLRAMLERFCDIRQEHWLDPDELRQVHALRRAS